MGYEVERMGNVLFSIRYGIPKTMTSDPSARRIIGLLRISRTETINT